MTYYLYADRFLFPTEEKGPGYLEINKGKFGTCKQDVSNTATIIDYSGRIIAPGLFDTHIHGMNGYDVMDGTVEAIKAISSSILSLGVTRFLPTTLTSSRTNLSRSLKAIKDAVDSGLPGALSEGIFLEGPYFTRKYKGAQQETYFTDPNIAEFESWQELSGGNIQKVALAPERNGSMEFIKHLHEQDIVIGIGHTDATNTCCREAIQAGASIFIHLFNGMRGLHHREPGVVGSALVTDTYTELICDGHHVHPQIATMTYQLKQDKLVLITDCMCAGLMNDGEYTLGEQPVKVQEGIARTKTGNLAGSTLKLIDSVKNLKKWSKEPLFAIWHLASLSPAASMGIANKLGSLEVNKCADYVVLDKALNIVATAVNGEIKYNRNEKREWR